MEHEGVLSQIFTIAGLLLQFVCTCMETEWRVYVVSFMTDPILVSAYMIPYYTGRKKTVQ